MADPQTARRRSVVISWVREATASGMSSSFVVFFLPSLANRVRETRPALL